MIMTVFRRYLRKMGFIYICIVTILLFLSLMVNNIQGLRVSMDEANNQMTKNSINIYFSDKIQTSDMIERINKLMNYDNVIIKYFLQTGFNYENYYSYGIYFNGDINNSYNLIEGRFFNANDFKNNERIAVIGKDIKKYSFFENNQRYILRDNKKYKVIGILGKEDMSSRYDGLILYNLNSILDGQEILYNQTWLLDSVKLSRDKLKSIINSIDRVNIQFNDSIILNPNPLELAIKENKIVIINAILIIFSILLTLITSSIRWIDSISLEIAVRKSYGATIKNILFDLINRFLTVSIIALITSVLIYNGLFKFKVVKIASYNMSALALVLNFTAMLIIGVIVISISLYKINKIPINVLLKGN